MDENAPLAPAPRRSRVGLLTVFVILALVVGLALIFLSMRDGTSWWQRQAKAPTAVDKAVTTRDVIAGTSPAPAAVDPATLAARESALAAQLAALEARTASLSMDVTQSQDRAGRAEAILIAFAARRAIEKGAALGYLEDQLRQRFGETQQKAVNTVIEAGRDPVTREGLRQALDANRSMLLNPGADGWFAGFMDELRRLVVLHDANTPSPLPADRLARAQRLLDAGQVEPAVEEVSRLPGGTQAANWSAAARRYIAARQALDTLETAAIVGTIPSSAPTAAAALVPAVPQVTGDAAPATGDLGNDQAEPAPRP
ncbi:hypothetical protein [Sphingomonas olei]|uniref:Inner membrane protein n=1 Tax=Sphingomonas olei TaxID=1886787 RepID=A0ABY2QMF1_9SPHN|nr:hypothetical protein [Sphingomonas olei]THG42095.1 hypothetical protein E5988_01135 [Sphingomonas olei]